MEVQVDFAFFDPEEIDYHAIKNFLLPFLEGQAFNAGDLADLIIKQNEYVGTVVKVEGEDETYGFVSVVNLHKHKVRENMPGLHHLHHGHRHHHAHPCLELLMSPITHPRWSSTQDLTAVRQIKEYLLSKAPNQSEVHPHWPSPVRANSQSHRPCVLFAFAERATRVAL